MNKYLEEYEQLQKEYLADDIERTRLLAHPLNFDEQVEEIANRQWVNRDRRQVLEIILNNPYLQEEEALKVCDRCGSIGAEAIAEVDGTVWLCSDCSDRLG